MDERRNDEHKLTMVGRNKMTVTGVEDVDSFDDDKIVAYTTEGVMTVKGADFRINRLSVDLGGRRIIKKIDSIEYADGHKSDKGGFLSKIFR